MISNGAGSAVAPELAIAASCALGFWKAIEEVWPRTRSQRCWVHEDRHTCSFKLPKSRHSKAKRALQEIWMAETRNHADSAFDAFIETYAVKYDKAAACLVKDRETMLAFYDFPAEHWKHRCARTNPIESRHSPPCDTVPCDPRDASPTRRRSPWSSNSPKRHRTVGAASTDTTCCPSVIVGVKFIDGIEAVRQQPQAAA